MDTAPAESSPEQTVAPAAPLIPWWVWPLGVGIALLLVAVVWIVAIAAPIPVQPAGAPPQFTVYPPPSFTPVLPTLAPTLYVTATLGLPTVMPGTIGVGARVEVTGTSGDGVRLRDAPSTSGKILYLADDHEIFNVVDGPKTGNGYTWWKLQGAHDTTQQGWAVENFLKPSSP